MNKTTSRVDGFTIVELLIVIVVIAILAAISIVAYTGVQNRARASTAQADLANAKKQLQLAQIDNGSYPTTTTSLTPSNGTTFELTANNSTSPQTFCLTATNGNISYKISESTIAAQGSCPGHSSNGVAAITNLILDPKGVGTTNWYQRLDGTQTDTANVSWGARTDWHRLVRGTSHGTFRIYVPLSSLENGQTYAGSVLVANPGASSMTVYTDFCDLSTGSITLAPGQTARISGSASRGTYDSVYRFFDIDIPPGASGILVSDVMVTKGSIIYNYADGNSPNWIWNGAPNASSSTGPPV